MEGFMEWAAMGGYGMFVWPGYAAALAGLAWIVGQPMAARRRSSSRGRRDEKMSDGR